MNKVGSMLNKTVGSMGNKKGEANTYKPAGVHVLGEDYFPQDNLMITEDSDSLPSNNTNLEKQNSNVGSISSNILPSVTEKKSLSSSMKEILGVSQPPQKNKQKAEDADFMKGFNLINGEKIIHSDKCNIKIDKELISCRALITNYRVYILPDFKKKIGEFSYYNYFPENFFSLLIHKIDKAVKTSNEKSFVFTMEIYMNDKRIINIVFKNNAGDSFLDRLNGLLSLKERPSYSNLAFEYKKNHPIYKKQNFEDGWNIYNPEKEYERQGITNLDYEVSRNKLFRKTKLNENYTLCATYPKFLITVGEITESDYKGSSEFRTKNRLPTLAYYHAPTKGTIWRSAQTKSGLTGNRNRFDEELLSDIGKISDSRNILIYDCRPYLSAMANKLKGAGFENVENYPGAEIIFCEIDHIHSARSALGKIYSLLKYNRFSEDKKFLSNFENTGWPNFIYGIIRASINIAYSIRKGCSVLIHCSDGWDRCSQLTAFSQLLIDPYFRTIRGYMTLIEKDFLYFGHQFKLRNGYYSKEEHSENQSSPILLQYLDATHQLLVQYPMYFEFNMKFLLFIANSINCGLYGTFLYNNEKEREQKNAKTNTMSCWTEILNNINQYKNPFYDPNSKKYFFFTPIFPFSRIRLWEEYFFPYTQININISYNSYINRFNDNFYYNIFGQMKQKTRIISNVMFIDREKDNYEKNLDKLKKENQKLKMALAEFTINNNINKELYDNLNKETKGIIQNLAKEHGGEINLDQDLNIYTYKQIKPITKDEENIKIEDIIKSEENKNENEIKTVDIERKSSKINKEKIEMFFGSAIKKFEEKQINDNLKIDEINKEEKKEKKTKEKIIEKDNDKKEIKENKENKEIEKIENIVENKENEENNKEKINNTNDNKKEINVIKDKDDKQENKDQNMNDENNKNNENDEIVENKDNKDEKKEEEKTENNGNEINQNEEENKKNNEQNENKESKENKEEKKENKEQNIDEQKNESEVIEEKKEEIKENDDVQKEENENNEIKNDKEEIKEENNIQNKE